MAGSPATLAIKIVSDASDTTKDFRGTAQAASDMGDTVDAASKQVATAARRMDGAADAADNLGGEAGKATGALGALSSGFELVGLDQYAAGLQGAAMATDFFSGVGDALNLVMESQALQWIKNTALTVKDAVVKGVATTATAAQTAAQWALNAAMAASPVLLIVAGVALLVAGIILAYKKSETFRRIVTAAFEAVKAAANAVWSFIKSAWSVLFDVLTLPFRLQVAVVKTVFNAVRDSVVWIKDKIVEMFGNARDKVRDAFDAMKDKAAAIGSYLTAPFTAVVDVIKDVIEWIKKIPKPDLGFIGDALGAGKDFVGGLLPRAVSGRTATTTAPLTSTNVYLTVTGAVDPISTGRQIVDILTDYLRATGQTTLVVNP